MVRNELLLIGRTAWWSSEKKSGCHLFKGLCPDSYPQPIFPKICKWSVRPSLSVAMHCSLHLYQTDITTVAKGRRFTFHPGHLFVQLVCLFYSSIAVFSYNYILHCTCVCTLKIVSFHTSSKLHGLILHMQYVVNVCWGTPSIYFLNFRSFFYSSLWINFDA